MGIGLKKLVGDGKMIIVITNVDPPIKKTEKTEVKNLPHLSNVFLGLRSCHATEIFSTSGVCRLVLKRINCCKITGDFPVVLLRYVIVLLFLDITDYIACKCRVFTNGGHSIGIYAGANIGLLAGGSQSLLILQSLL